MFYFEDYELHLKQLPMKDNFQKEDLMTDSFLFAKDNNVEVFWAPFEYLNTEAKVMIVGITPGWTQMQLAFQYVRKHIDAENREKVLINAKKQASFGGKGIRKNLIEMLDGIELNEALHIKTCADLYDEKNHFLHSTSTLRYPVFINKKNYTGSSPSMLKRPFLLKMIQDLFVPEVNKVPNAMIIPAGKAVSEVLRYLFAEGKIRHQTILYNFPHPSGANGHRKRQFEDKKEDFKATVKKHFS